MFGEHPLHVTVLDYNGQATYLDEICHQRQFEVPVEFDVVGAYNVL